MRDGSVRVWNVETGELAWMQVPDPFVNDLDMASPAASDGDLGPDRDRAECRQYLHVDACPEA